MSPKNSLSLVLTLSLTLVSPAGARLPESYSSIPTDPALTQGQLDNGLTYYVRVNRKPAKRAELRLVVNAGSLVEDDDQLGLAHFVEHMAFNGTTHFAKQQLTDYLESIGMGGGADYNAFTGYDETVYMLHVPTDDAEILAKAFQILEDWAHGIKFDDEEIEQERKVVLEELRLNRGVGSRMFDKQAPEFLKGSRYLDRLPIGEKDILETASGEALRRFYKDWYRPDLMAVVAVGDFDPEEVEKKIHEHFARLDNPVNPRPRESYPVPDHEETRFRADTDPELTMTAVEISYKHDVSVASENPIDDARKELAEMFYTALLNARLSEIALTASPPFVGASCGQGELVRTKEIYALSAGLKENEIRQGIEALTREAQRVRRHGFTPPELKRGKLEFLRMLEMIYQERGKMDSSVFVSEYVDHFFNGGPLVDIEYVYPLAQKLISELTLADVGQMADQWIRDDNRVILLSAPDTVELPSEQEVLALIDRVEASDVEPYDDDFVDRELIAEKPRPSKVVDEKYIADLDVTEWTFANGLRVVLKPTDFQNDQIIFTAFSPGGHSLYPDEDYVAATTANSFISRGEFDTVDLGKSLAGKAVNVSSYVGTLEEGFYGDVSPADMETLFQMIHLAFVAPRRDPALFQSAQEKILEGLRHKSPGQEFAELIRAEMTRNHYRSRPFSEQSLAEMDLDRSFEIYRERFADAGDFTFILVGNLSPGEIRPLAETYLGSLPTQGRKETWKDIDVHPPEGVVKKELKRGHESQSAVRLIFTGPFTWTRESQHVLSSLGAMLQLRLHDHLREKLGDTYGVGVSTGCFDEYCFYLPQYEYQVSVGFGCAPEKVDKLVEAVFEEIENLKAHGPKSEDLRNLEEGQRRFLEAGLKENGFWLTHLESFYTFDEDPLTLLRLHERIGTVSAEAVREAANTYLDTGNYAQFVLYPEKAR